MKNHTIRRSVVAFDLDNTLADPDMSAYKTTRSALLASCDLGLNFEEAVNAFEYVRKIGDSLERIGLRNPTHERANPDGLAVLCLMNCMSAKVRGELDIDPDEQRDFRELLSALASAHCAAGDGTFGERLEAEFRAREFCMNDPRIQRLLHEVQRIAEHSLILGWAETYRTLDLAQPTRDWLPLMESLSERGFMPLVISEGRTRVQLEKLAMLGLADYFRGRTLITDAAADITGAAELNTAVDRLIEDRIAGAAVRVPPELPFLWYFRCLLDSWATKSPGFYARCLHVLHADGEAPGDFFNRPVYVQADQWQRKPMRFVMIGDKYDKDVVPLIDLLGANVAMTIRLRMGKYAHLNPEHELPEHLRPGRTFPDCESLVRFVMDELEPDDIQTIHTPPTLIPHAWVNREYLERGLGSRYEAVRSVSEAILPMIHDV